MSGQRPSLLKEWLPPALYRPLLSALAKYNFLRWPDKALLVQNCEIPRLRKNDRAFLLATGPSLKEEDLSTLAGEECFSISNFFLHEEVQRLAPKLHFFAPYHPPLILENFIAWLRQGDEALPPETDIVLGHTDARLVREHGLFPKRKVYYLYLDPLAHVGHLDLRRPILSPQTGPLMILPVLIAMGYKEIYLLGCDHTVLRDFRKSVQNFYDPAKDPRKNATDTGSWMDVIKAHQSSLNVFLQYEKYKRALRRHYPGVRIVNLSQDSWLDLFEVGRLGELLKSPSAS